MRTISALEMSNVSGGKLSQDCIEGLVAEGLAYASMFFVTSVVGGAIALAGLVVAPIVMAIACKNG